MVRQKQNRLPSPETANRPEIAIAKTCKRNDLGDGGVWVCGRILGFRFEALVFAEHALDESFELGESRISKLWLQDPKTHDVVFEFDRGPSIAAANEQARLAVYFLSEALAAQVFGA